MRHPLHATCEKVMKFEGFLSLFREKLHKKRPGVVPRSVDTAGWYCSGTHDEPCMAVQLFVL